MIDSLHISGFKVFRDLSLPRLGKLNLLVGKNNTGKTCLLEAVEVYASRTPWDIFQVAARRGVATSRRSRISRIDPFEWDPSLQSLFSLFHREGGVPDAGEITLKAGKPQADLSLKCDPHLAEMMREDSFFFVEMDKDRPSRKNSLLRMLEESFEITRGKVKKGKGPPLTFFLRPGGLPPEILEEQGWLHRDAVPVAFLPARGLSLEDSRRYWDSALNDDRNELVLDWLRLIEPKIRDLHFVKDPSSSSEVPTLKINSDRGRTPLASSGDGLTRLFHIALAMASASGGILLIDEFENGLHWEVQEEIWKALFKASDQFGVQVFATTHSNDCIRAFVAAQTSMLVQKECQVYRLERNGDDVTARELPIQNVSDALGLNVEVR